ncbi:hypothetical protein OG618_03795 [Kitasatospora sp. NBC_01246]|uniref:hypothetical protein n=1 Tax=Kitasatospora sp. NBC_01246 TaxID=2903570 RepID=UPI002E37BB54|nr:hypothetical protein [Kitasatospora sp. NBC_01246]
MAATPGARRTAAAATALVAAAAVGTGLWWTLGRDDPDRDCAGLRTDARVRTVLGDTWRSDLPCGELAAGLRRATVGTRPGAHTLGQAHAMRTVVLAVADSAGHRVHPDVRGPLAEALADYAADTHTVLTGVSNTAMAHDGPDDDAWQDDRGVHFAVREDQLIEVLRGLAESAAAYAGLRGADLRQGAAGLAAVPAAPSPAAIEDPLARAAAPAGVFDGIADDVLRGRSGAARTAWQEGVLQGLAPAGAPPAFGDAPAEYLARTWLGRLAEPAPTARERFARLDDQANGLLGLWADATHQDGAGIGLPALRDRARASTDRERGAAAGQLKQES